MGCLPNLAYISQDNPVYNQSKNGLRCIAPDVKPALSFYYYWNYHIILFLSSSDLFLLLLLLSCAQFSAQFSVGESAIRVRMMAIILLWGYNGKDPKIVFCTRVSIVAQILFQTLDNGGFVQDFMTGTPNTVSVPQYPVA